METEYLDIKEVTRFVHLGQSSVYSKMALGIFPRSRKARNGGRVLWVKSEVQAWLDAEYSLPEAAAA